MNKNTLVSFTIKTSELRKTLGHLKIVVPNKGKRAKATVCEITLTDGKINVTVPGASFYIIGSTHGTGKATVPFLLFYQLIKHIKDKTIDCIIEVGSLKINNVTITAETTFFETDAILRTVQLTANYTEKDLLLLLNKGYTWQELEFNNLSSQLFTAHTNLYATIEKAYQLLHPYGVVYDELEKLVISRLNMHQS